MGVVLWESEWCGMRRVRSIGSRRGMAVECSGMCCYPGSREVTTTCSPVVLGPVAMIMPVLRFSLRWPHLSPSPATSLPVVQRPSPGGTWT